MKNTIKFLAILLISFTFNSCDEVEKLADVKFSTSITEKIPVHIGQNQEYMSEMVTLNLDNSDTHDYLNELKNVSIKKVQYKFIDFTGNEDCYINVEIASDGVVLETKEFYVQQAYSNETVYEITDIDKVNAMATALKNNKQIEFKMEGEVFGGISDFKIEVTLELEIIANPL